MGKTKTRKKRAPNRDRFSEIVSLSSLPEDGDPVGDIDLALKWLKGERVEERSARPAMARVIQRSDLDPDLKRVLANCFSPCLVIATHFPHRWLELVSDQANTLAERDIMLAMEVLEAREAEWAAAKERKTRPVRRRDKIVKEQTERDLCRVVGERHGLSEKTVWNAWDKYFSLVKSGSDFWEASADPERDAKERAEIDKKVQAQIHAYAARKNLNKSLRGTK